MCSLRNRPPLSPSDIYPGKSPKMSSRVLLETRLGIFPGNVLGCLWDPTQHYVITFFRVLFRNSSGASFFFIFSSRNFQKISKILPEIYAEKLPRFYFLRNQSKDSIRKSCMDSLRISCVDSFRKSFNDAIGKISRDFLRDSFREFHKGFLHRAKFLNDVFRNFSRISFENSSRYFF